MASYTWSTIRERLADRAEHKPFWDPTEARDAFNEALLQWNMLTGTWKTRLTITTVLNQYDYQLADSMIYRMRMTFNSLPVDSSSREEFNNGRYRWRTETTASGGDVPRRPTLFAPISLNMFYLWPADAVGGNTLTLDGVAATPVIVEDGDTVDLTEELLTTLLGYSLHALTFKKGGPTFASTMSLFKAFLTEAADQNDLIKTSQVYRRVMGLDRRDLKQFRNTPTLLDLIVQGMDRGQ